jgi:hypothetical protein
MLDALPMIAAHPAESVPLSRAIWHARAREHAARVGAYAEAFVRRRSRGEVHPVQDFLFTYYPFSPAKLRQWTPQFGESLEMGADDLEAHPWLRGAAFICKDDVLRHDMTRLTDGVRERARWIANLCTGIESRPAHFRCHGLHEWAMVYRQSREQIRHSGHELRLAPDDLARFVESQNLCCTHYDAFRFFTPEAAPRNSVQPTLDARPALEQGGCLHANMDLYKWAQKLWPWSGGDLIADCFLLALAGRDLDMRASPYDLQSLGYAPIRIETAEGREAYAWEQKRLAEQAAPVREHVRRLAEKVATAR